LRLANNGSPPVESRAARSTAGDGRVRPGPPARSPGGTPHTPASPPHIDPHPAEPPPPPSPPVDRSLPPEVGPPPPLDPTPAPVSPPRSDAVPDPGLAASCSNLLWVSPERTGFFRDRRPRGAGGVISPAAAPPRGPRTTDPLSADAPPGEAPAGDNPAGETPAGKLPATESFVALWVTRGSSDGLGLSPGGGAGGARWPTAAGPPTGDSTRSDSASGGRGSAGPRSTAGRRRLAEVPGSGEPAPGPRGLWGD